MPSQWRNRIVRRGDATPDQLLANPYNFRTHSKFQQDTMESVLDEIGWVQDVIVNVTTDHVLDGHMRIILAMRHDESTIPCTWIKVTEDEEKVILATFDHIGSMAGVDKELLEQLVKDAHPQDENLDKLLANLNPRSNRNPIEEDVDEEIISPELFERQDYLIIAFDNEFDWQAACTKMGVGVVVSTPANRRTMPQRGVGRVISGKDFLARVQHIESGQVEQSTSSENSQ